MANLVSRVQSMMAKAHTAVYRRSDGRMGAKMFGAPVLLLNTIGRKSGKARTTPLLYLVDGEDFVIVASAGGAPRHPAWWLNLKAAPRTEVEVDGRTVLVRAEEASPAEKARLWPRLVDMYSGYAGYQKKTEREIPVVLLHPLQDA